MFYTWLVLFLLIIAAGLVISRGRSVRFTRLRVNIMTWWARYARPMAGTLFAVALFILLLYAVLTPLQWAVFKGTAGFFVVFLILAVVSVWLFGLLFRIYRRYPAGTLFVLAGLLLLFVITRDNGGAPYQGWWVNPFPKVADSSASNTAATNPAPSNSGGVTVSAITPPSSASKPSTTGSRPQTTSGGSTSSSSSSRQSTTTSSTLRSGQVLNTGTLPVKGKFKSYDECTAYYTLVLVPHVDPTDENHLCTSDKIDHSKG